MTSEILLLLERELHLKPKAAADALGIAYSTYMGYRETVRKLPKYIHHSAEALLALPLDVRSRIVEARLG